MTCPIQKKEKGIPAIPCNSRCRMWAVCPFKRSEVVKMSVDNTVKFLFDIEQATSVLAEVNIGVAAIFHQEPKPVRFVFLTYIAPEAREKNTKIVLGQCIQASPLNEIQLRICEGWQNTSIHELVHLYNPGASERQVVKITRDVIKYLKAKNA